MHWIVTNWKEVGGAFTVVWMSLNVALHVIAPRTKWTGDDKAAGFFAWVEKYLVKVFVPAKYLSSDFGVTSLGGGKGGGVA